MLKLKGIIENSDTKMGKAFDLCIQALIVISLISFAIETLPNLSEETKYTLWLIQVVSVVIFSIEYLARIAVATNKFRFIFSFFGIIDLLAIDSKGNTVGIQVTSYSNISARLKKMEDSDAIHHLREANWVLLVQGWHKKNNKWVCREVDIS